MSQKIADLTTKLGQDPSNIKVVKNFMPEQDVKEIKEYLQLLDNLQTAHFLIENVKSKFKTRELLRVYENLMRLEAMKLYDCDFENDRGLDLNFRRDKNGLDIHSDFIRPHRFDGLDIPELQDDNRWSGHLSVLVYLNDDFEGGEIYFPQHEIEIKPEAGMLIAFPGNVNFLHGIRPFESTRYSISLWTRFSESVE